MTFTKSKLSALLVVALIGALSAQSCMTVPKAEEIPAAMTPMQMIQKAQEAFDAGNFEAALAYYQTAIARNSDNMSVVCQCEYEIAFIHYKQGAYEIAATELKALLARFAEDKTFSLPLEYKRLAEIVLAKIVEKTATDAAKTTP